MVHSFAVHNGSVLPAGSIHFSPFQTGLLSGWGLFSTLRIYQAVPFELDAHVDRLKRDAELLHVNIEPWLGEIAPAFEALIDRNLRQKGLPAEAMARVYFIRNRGGLLDVPDQRDSDFLLFTADLKSWGASAKLRTQPHGRHSQAPLACTKTLTWAHNLVLLEDANRQGFDDVLLLNEFGELAECTSANIFLVKDGFLLTPPLTAGALPGISRKVILDACHRAGVPCREARVTVDDLKSASEVFISSSTREVQPISQVDQQSFPVPGPLTQRVEELFAGYVHDYVGSHQKPAAGSRKASGH